MIAGRGFRLLLWLGVVVTAGAYRRKSPLLTAWLPHLLGNSALLWLPEIYRAVSALFRLVSRSPGRAAPILSGADQVIREVVVDNPRYATYLAPPAIAFMLAYPGHNMYQSKWANRQLGGMGLDSIPHAVTAFVLTQMLYDTLQAVRRVPGALGVPMIEALLARPARTSAAVVAAVSVWYEASEFLIRKSELRATGGDEEQVVMTWSLLDSIQDLIANAVGVAVAILLNWRKQSGQIR